MMRRFREELGIHIGTFITRCKLEEAKILLTYSDKSLADISNYFCFSSQSYFQNVFKKQYGITPMQYRKNTQKK
jgi:AraC-like DNA-binding protein